MWNVEAKSLSATSLILGVSSSVHTRGLQHLWMTVASAAPLACHLHLSTHGFTELRGPGLRTVWSFHVAPPRPLKRQPRDRGLLLMPHHTLGQTLQATTWTFRLPAHCVGPLLCHFSSCSQPFLPPPSTLIY